VYGGYTEKIAYKNEELNLCVAKSPLIHEKSSKAMMHVTGGFVFLEVHV